MFATHQYLFTTMKRLAFFLLTMLISGYSLSVAAGSEPIRDTEQGQVKGVASESMLAFKGIPYAAPPTGQRRFAPPAPPAIRSELLDASKFASDCPQISLPGTSSGGTISEDCLYLNVYTPQAEGSYPVMVWIHGGAFVAGSGGAFYNPSRLVAQDVVVVTLNYRLGALGFLAHPSLTAAQGGGSGNYGLMDQQQALRWVQDNISNFGGDPSNVTIFGESAGGHSVLSHLVSPQSSGLFHRAIVQSGSYDADQRSLAEAEKAGRIFALGVGCGLAWDVPACLRALPVGSFMIGPPLAANLTPNTHPQLLPQTIAQALQNGEINGEAVLIGSNRDELTIIPAVAEIGGGLPMSMTSVRAIWSTLLGPGRALQVAAHYPAIGLYSNPSRRFAATLGDSSFACPALKQAQQLAAVVPTYAYEFADRNAPSILPRRVSFDLGAAHSFELPYLLHSEAGMRQLGASNAQVALSEDMIQYWTAFARTGDPNQGSASASWPAFGSTSSLRWLNPAKPSNTTRTSTAFSNEHRCAFWDSIGALSL